MIAILDRAVHAFDLSVRPRGFGLCQPVLDVELGASELGGGAESAHQPLWCFDLGDSRVAGAWGRETAVYSWLRLIGSTASNGLRLSVSRFTKQFRLRL